MPYTYRETLQELEALLTGHWITDLANTSALLMSHVSDINWVGFYIAESNDPLHLWLGPFQGLPACTEIPFGKGVCGTAAEQKKTLVVADVDQFPGHIVCDSRSRSEVVVPLIKDSKVIGVLDVDSALVARFQEQEKAFFESVVKTLMNRYTA